jgi:hypothetical protein
LNTMFPSIPLWLKWNNLNCDHTPHSKCQYVAWLLSGVNVNIFLTADHVPLGWIFISVQHMINIPALHENTFCGAINLQYTAHYYMLFITMKEIVILKAVKMTWKMFMPVSDMSVRIQSFPFRFRVFSWYTRNLRMKWSVHLLTLIFDNPSPCFLFRRIQ